MSYLIPFLIIAIALLTFRFCTTPSQSTSENKIIQVDIENCKVSIDLKLSDLIDSCWLVPLETRKESVLGNSYWYFYITDNYIIVDDNSGIYLFATDGKFIDKIIKSGRGPNEISIVHSIYYYEKKDLLFINDQFNNLNSLLCYDLKSRTFKPPIKKCFPNQWEDFMIYNDSLIVGSPNIFDTDSNPYALFFQDFKGNLLSGIKSKRNVITRGDQKLILQRMRFYSGDQKVHVKYIYDDTLFALNANRLSPYLIINYNSAKIDPPSMSTKLEDKRSSFERFENSSFLIFRNQTYKGSIPFNAGTKAKYQRKYFLLNKSNGNFGTIQTYTDDLIGKIQSPEDEIMTFPSSLPNNKLYVLYSPLELLQNNSTGLTGLKFPESLNVDLNKIKSNLHETDNPVLLIGKPKKKLLILK
jgi:hypothetical protein